MLEVETLTDGGQTATDVAKQVAAFIDGAQKTLDLAMYDLRLDGDADTIVHAALTSANARGVAIRIAFNVDHPARSPSRHRRPPSRRTSRRSRSRATASPASPT